jgi:hypothetical protein
MQVWGRGLKLSVFKSLFNYYHLKAQMRTNFFVCVWEMKIFKILE